MPRFSVKCKDEKYLTYAVFDSITKSFVEDTEDTDLDTVNGYCDECEFELNSPAPPHGSLYGEPCGDRN